MSDYKINPELISYVRSFDTSAADYIERIEAENNNLRDMLYLHRLARAERKVTDKVTDIIKQFIKDNGISSPDTIHQCDWVIENAYGFIEELCDAVGYLPEEEEDE